LSNFFGVQPDLPTPQQYAINKQDNDCSPHSPLAVKMSVTLVAYYMLRHHQYCAHFWMPHGEK